MAGVSDSRLPLAVLVSGAPGSGKTTLAAEVGQRLLAPVAHKDRLREGQGLTANRDRTRDVGAIGPELFYRTMELWLGLGVSAVGEMTFVRGPSEPDVARRLVPLGHLINVHCQAVDSARRWESRTRANPEYGDDLADQLLSEAHRMATELWEYNRGIPAACRQHRQVDRELV